VPRARSEPFSPVDHDAALLSPRPTFGTFRALRPPLGQGGSDLARSPSATRFLETLAEHRLDSVTALPRHLQPLAAAIAGPAPVAVRAGPGTAAALAAAGKPAATIGRVIHLPLQPDRSARTREVVAHELVHAARPSPTPRFFGDDHNDDEEGLAWRVGALARSLASTTDARATGRPELTYGTNGLVVVPRPRAHAGEHRGGAGSHGAVSTTLAPGWTEASPRQGQASAGLEAPWPLLGRSRIDDAGASFGSRPPVQGAPGDASASSRPGGRSRQTSTTPSSAAPASRAGGTPAPFPAQMPSFARSSHQRLPGINATMTKPATSPSLPQAEGPPLAPETLEWIIERVERHVIEELERRGVRHNPGVL
jgi:hypothetical protein